MNILAGLFFSELRAEVFRLLFGLRAQRLYRAQIINLTKFKGASVEEELVKLRKLGLLVAEPDGNRVYYSANTAHPLYPEIRNLVLKTVGLRDVLATALADSSIEFAFVFGSIGSDTAKPESDVDVMVIGDITDLELAKRLRGVGEQLGREVNPHAYSRDEFARRVAANDHFLNDVLEKPKLFVIGSENEFTRLAQRRLDSTA